MEPLLKRLVSGPVLAAHLSASTTRPSVDVQSVSLFTSHRCTRHMPQDLFDID
jgi:hypothetical protein